MEFLKDFFIENLVIVFFVYGVSFYILSFSIIFSMKPLRDINIAKPFLFLLLFGFTHGTAEFMDMFSIIGSKFFYAELPLYSICKAGLLYFSFVFLLIFAIELLSVLKLKRPDRSGAYPTIFIVLLALLYFGISLFYGTPVSEKHFDTNVRYFIAFPASLLSAIGTYFLSKNKNIRGKLPENAGKYLFISAFGFLIYGIFGGLVVAESEFFPDYDSFLSNVGIPVQVFRATAALSIGYLFVMAMSLTLSMRTWCAYGTVLVTMTAIGMSDFITLKQIVVKQKNIVKLYAEDKSCSDLEMAFTKMSNYLFGIRKTDEEFEKLRITFEKELRHLKGVKHKEKEEDILLAEIDEGYGKLLNINKRHWDKKPYLLIEEIKNDIYAVSKLHRGEIFSYINMTDELSRHAFNTHIIGFIAACIVFVFVGYKLVKMILIPVSTLEHGVIEIKKGNLSHRIKLHTGDEFQDIAEEYNVMAEALLDREKKLKETRDEMERLSITDGMTGLFNYRYFCETLGKEIERAYRYKVDLSLIMLDVDHFKQYNDMHGHPMGDEVLRLISSLLRDNIRKIDIPCRYGGEEFAIVLPSTDKGAALLVAEKIRESVESYHFPYEESMPNGNLTVSIGVAVFPDDAKECEALVKKADAALYRAKSEGRNRVCSIP